MTRLARLDTSRLGERLGSDGAGSDGPAELQLILQVVARELTELGRMACDLQVGLSPLERSPGVGDTAGRSGAGAELCDAAIGSLHNLDLLTQELHALATFLEALAPSLPAHWTGDAAGAAETVTLSGLARRLGTPALDDRQARAAEAGSLEMFEMTGV